MISKFKFSMISMMLGDLTLEFPNTTCEHTFKIIIILPTCAFHPQFFLLLLLNSPSDKRRTTKWYEHRLVFFFDYFMSILHRGPTLKVCWTYKVSKCFLLAGIKEGTGRVFAKLASA
jgi:hypothetical protein